MEQEFINARFSEHKNYPIRNIYTSLLLKSKIGVIVIKIQHITLNY